MRIYLLALAAATIVSMSPNAAMAACRDDALGTHRTLTLDPADHKKIIGKEKHLGLRAKEVILTFDDGPRSGTTQRILDTLRDECVKATFFAVGKMARANPKLAKRIVRRGHTLAHHTTNHERLPKYSVQKAAHFVERGMKMVEKAAYGSYDGTPRTPFFRYPYLARSRATDRLVSGKGLIAFDANIDSLDWKKVSPDKVHNRIMRLLRREGKGIVLMHDIQHRTAKMLPRLLRTLKNEGYKIVHIVGPNGTPSAPADEVPVLVASANTSVNKSGESGGIPALPATAPKPKKQSSFEDITAQSPIGIYTKKQSQALIQQALADMAPVDNLDMTLFEPDNVIITTTKPEKPKAKRLKLAKLRTGKIASNAPDKTGQTASFGAWKLRPSQWIIR